MKKLVPWLLSLAALGFAPILAIAFDPGSITKWLPAYWAGAAGGLMLELIGGSWGVELPSMGKKGPPDKRFKPFGPWVDLGFFARMTQGALAAPVFLILVNSLLDGKSNEELMNIATNFDTLAWAVLIGMASPAVWKAGEALVAARMGQLNQAVVAEHVKGAEEELKEVADSVDPQAKPAIRQVIGKLQSTPTRFPGTPPATPDS